MNKKSKHKKVVEEANSSKSTQSILSSCSTVSLNSSTESFSNKLEYLAKKEAELEKIDVKIRNSLKKLTRNDIATREKGLEELYNSLEVSREDAKKSFPYFVDVLPRLLDDGTCIRQQSLNVLQKYILFLKKDCERYLKMVVPYVFFSLYDQSALVAKSATSLLNNCFPEKKQEVLTVHCLEAICEFLFRLIECDASDSERTKKLKTQAFLCLKNMCIYATAEMKSRLISLCNSDRILLSCGLLNLGVNMAWIKWEEVFSTKLVSLALREFGSNDPVICCSALEFIIEYSQWEKLCLNELYIEIIPRMYSIVNQRQKSWMYVSDKLVTLTGIIYIRLENEKGVKFLSKMFEKSISSGMVKPQETTLMEYWIHMVAGFFDLIVVALHDRKEACNVDSELQTVVAKVFTLVKDCIDSEIKDHAVIRKLVTITRAALVRSNDVSQEVLRKFEEKFVDHLAGSIFADLFIKEIHSSLSIPSAMKLYQSILLKDTVSLELFIFTFAQCSNDIISQSALRIMDRVEHYIEEWCNMDDRITNDVCEILYILLKISSVVPDIKIIDFLKKFGDQYESLCFGLVNVLQKPQTISENSLRISENDCFEIIKSAKNYTLYSNNEDAWIQLIDFILGHQNRISLLQLILKDSVLSPRFIDCLLAKVQRDTLSHVYLELYDAILLIFDRFSMQLSDEFLSMILKCVLACTNPYIFVEKYFDKHSTCLIGNKIIQMIALQFPTEILKEIVITRDELISFMRECDSAYAAEILEENEFLGAFRESGILNCTLVFHEKFSTDEWQKIASKAMLYLHLHEKLKDYNEDTEFLSYSLIYSLIFNAFRSGLGVEYNLQFDFQVYLQIFYSKIVNDKKVNSNLLSILALVYQTNPSITCLYAIRHLGSSFTMPATFDSMLVMSLVKKLDLTNPAHLCDLSACVRFVIKEDYSASVDQIYEFISFIEMNSSVLNSKKIISIVRDVQKAYGSEVFLCPTENIDLGINLLNVSLLRLLARIACRYFSELNDESRDIICCGMLTALKSCVENVSCDSVLSSLFSYFAAKLFITCANMVSVKLMDPCFDLFRTDSPQSSTSLPSYWISEMYKDVLPHSGVCTDISFRQEWNSFYRPVCESLILKWFLLLSEENHMYNPGKLKMVAAAVHFVSKESIKICYTGNNSENPEQLQERYFPHLNKFLSTLITLFSSTIASIQLAATRLFSKLIDDLLEQENGPEPGASTFSNLDFTGSKMGDGILRLLLSRILNNTDEDFLKSGRISPNLLMWDAHISYLYSLRIARRTEISSSTVSMVQNLILLLLKYVPAHPVKQIMFLDEKLYINGKSTEYFTLLEQYCFGLFCRVFQCLPSTTRQAFNFLKTRAESAKLNCYVTKYVSPLLWKAEKSQLLEATFPLELKVHISNNLGRLVKALYAVGDVNIDMKISFPDNYPLGIPQIEYEQSINQDKSKNTFVHYPSLSLIFQNGSIHESIMLWVREISEAIKGVDECRICLSIIDINSHQLPYLQCKQCKKSFHRSCLGTWFKKSLDPRCPLCRVVFH